MHRTLMALALASMAGALGGCGAFQDVRSISQELAKDGKNQDDIATGTALTVPPDATLRPPSTSTSATSGEGTARRAQVILKTTENPGTGATASTGRESGPSAAELFDQSMNHLGKASDYHGHSDRGRDTDGADVLVITNSADPTPIANCPNGVVKSRLPAGTQSWCLLSSERMAPTHWPKVGDDLRISTATSNTLPWTTRTSLPCACSIW